MNLPNMRGQVVRIDPVDGTLGYRNSVNIFDDPDMAHLLCRGVWAVRVAKACRVSLHTHGARHL